MYTDVYINAHPLTQYVNGGMRVSPWLGGSPGPVCLPAPPAHALPDEWLCWALDLLAGLSSF
ncbi:hypothetical protein JZ751_028332 [Albula glossodonta]|uniref:Uncharacterized protein n=1 Tax=Albula glossodonta TaxID=121402 RepID=A0A8T2NJ44_9TELE|nr:hypothetical protein JZ751_028332 [Albula glossodonta]